MHNSRSGPPRRALLALVLVAIGAGIAGGYWIFISLT
jgi:hypothetical protein